MLRVFETSTELPLDRDTVFEFFADAGNLERITPPELRFRVTTPLPIDIHQGALIDYRLRLYSIPFAWKTEITGWNPPESFVDSQLQGPFQSWVHTHLFAESKRGTMMHDRVEYRLPFSPIGELAYPLVQAQVRRIFAYRRRAIHRILLPRENSGITGR